MQVYTWEISKQQSYFFQQGILVHVQISGGFNDTVCMVFFGIDQIE